MKIKGIIDEDFLQYKKPCMVILCPQCTFKCEKDCGEQVCQNSKLAHSESFNYKTNDIIERYNDNDLTSAICFGGLEPLDRFDEIYNFIQEFRNYSDDDIVIYTGYTEEEIYNKRYIINNLKQFHNIIIKFGRFVPNQEKHYDKLLGVYLASNNQYGRKIS